MEGVSRKKKSIFHITYPDEAKFQFFLPYFYPAKPIGVVGIIKKEKKELKFGRRQ